MDKMIAKLMTDFGFNHETAEIVYRYAYESGHSTGETETYCIEYGYFADAIINANK